MTSDLEERLVASWEAIAKGLGDLNEIARTAISKQWPDVREPREAVVSRIPTAEEKAQQKTGNSVGPAEQWLSESPVEDEEEIGPREREFLSQQTKKSSGTKGT